MINQISGLVLVAFEALPKLKPLINPHNDKVSFALKIAHVESGMHFHSICIIIFLSDDEFTFCYHYQKFGTHGAEEREGVSPLIEPYSAAGVSAQTTLVL
jgi:hypothetical protein